MLNNTSSQVRDTDRPTPGVLAEVSGRLRHRNAHNRAARPGVPGGGAIGENESEPLPFVPPLAETRLFPHDATYFLLQVAGSRLGLMRGGSGVSLRFVFDSHPGHK